MSEAPAQPIASPNSTWVLPVVIAIVVAAGLFLIFKIFARSNQPMYFRVADRSFNLASFHPNDKICRLVGIGFQPQEADDVGLGEGPNAVIANIFALSQREVEIEPIGLTLARAGGLDIGLSTTRFRIAKRGETELVFEGSENNQGMRPIEHSVNLIVSLNEKSGGHPE